MTACRGRLGAGWSVRSPRGSTPTRSAPGAVFPRHPGPLDPPVSGGGFAELVPSARTCVPRTDTAVLEMAAALKRENPARTAAQVQRILRTATGWAPPESTLLRLFRRLELIGPAAGDARRCSAVSRPKIPMTAGPGTLCTARGSAGGKPICSPSSMIIPGCCAATVSASPRTPSDWGRAATRVGRPRGPCQRVRR